MTQYLLVMLWVVCFMIACDTTDDATNDTIDMMVEPYEPPPEFVELEDGEDWPDAHRLKVTEGFLYREVSETNSALAIDDSKGKYQVLLLDGEQIYDSQIIPDETVFCGIMLYDIQEEVPFINSVNSVDGETILTSQADYDLEFLSFGASVFPDESTNRSLLIERKDIVDPGVESPNGWIGTFYCGIYAPEVLTGGLDDYQSSLLARVSDLAEMRQAVGGHLIVFRNNR